MNVRRVHEPDDHHHDEPTQPGDEQHEIRHDLIIAPIAPIAGKLPRMTKDHSASKAEFVRGLPATMPAKQVIEQAKDAGLELSTAYVYVIRSQARLGTKKKNKTEKTAASSPRHASPSKGSEARLLAAASELGLTHSIEILQREKARLVRLLR